MAELVYGNSGDCRLELGNPSEAEVSASLLDLSRRNATRLVNSFVEKAYPSQIPFTASDDIPLLLNTITNDLSVYYVKRSLYPGPNPLSDTIKEEYYDKNIEVLKQIRDGELEISELAGKQASILANRSAYHPIHDVDNIENHNIDVDLLSDIDDARND